MNFRSCSKIIIKFDINFKWVKLFGRSRIEVTNKFKNVLNLVHNKTFVEWLRKKKSQFNLSINNLH